MATKTRINCPNCGSSVAGSLRFCPKCGHKLSANLNDDELIEDPYEILQVSRSASKEVVNASYKTLAKKFHPDSGSGDPEKIRKVNWAYEILSSPAKKTKWDAANSGKTNPPRPNPTKTSRNTYSGQTGSTKSSQPPKTNQERSTGPSLISGFGVVIIVLALVYLGNLFFQSGTFSATSTLRPTPRPTRQSNLVSAINALATKNAGYVQGCLQYALVTTSYENQNLCVFGIVYDDWSEGYYDEFGNQIGTTWFLVFNEEKTYGSRYFRVLSRTGWYNIVSGTCIRVDGIIKKFGDANYPYIDPFLDSSEIYTLPAASCN